MYTEYIFSIPEYVLDKNIKLRSPYVYPFCYKFYHFIKTRHYWVDTTFHEYSKTISIMNAEWWGRGGLNCECVDHQLWAFIPTWLQTLAPIEKFSMKGEWGCLIIATFCNLELIIRRLLESKVQSPKNLISPHLAALFSKGILNPITRGKAWETSEFDQYLIKLRFLLPSAIQGGNLVSQSQLSLPI